MAITYTTNAKLAVIPFDTLDWDVPVNDNTSILDGLAPVGSLCVTTSEVPSATLNVAVAAGKWRKNDGTVGSYAGISSTPVSASATTVLYLDSAGVLHAASSYPSATVIIPLATVVAGAGTITSIADDRIAFFQPYIQTSGANQVALTDSTGGTATSTIADVGASYDRTVLNANMASLAAKINMLRAGLVALQLFKGSS